MNHRFSEVSSELLVCMASFNPRNSFSNFDVDKLVRLAEIYAQDFDVGHILVLPSQLREFHLRITEIKSSLDVLNFQRLLKLW